MKILVNSKYYRTNYHHTCNILMFIYLMTAKLIYLVMFYETFNQILTLAPVRGLSKALKLSTTELFAKTVSCDIFKAVNFSCKSIQLRYLTGSERDSVGEHDAVLNIQTERSL